MKWLLAVLLVGFLGLFGLLGTFGCSASVASGAIKRLTERLDPRGYDVIPFSAPRGEGATHHYLWRFWRHVPKAGHIAIFDRSWYGRVLVERVEGFATEDEWRRAYQEVNEFERTLHESGIVLVKFWLHISPEEQVNRFRLREANPMKRHKIVDDLDILNLYSHNLERRAKSAMESERSPSIARSG